MGVRSLILIFLLSYDMVPQWPGLFASGIQEFIITRHKSNGHSKGLGLLS